MHERHECDRGDCVNAAAAPRAVGTAGHRERAAKGTQRPRGRGRGRGRASNPPRAPAAHLMTSDELHTLCHMVVQGRVCRGIAGGGGGGGGGGEGRRGRALAAKKTNTQEATGRPLEEVTRTTANTTVGDPHPPTSNAVDSCGRGEHDAVQLRDGRRTSHDDLLEWGGLHFGYGGLSKMSGPGSLVLTSVASVQPNGAASCVTNPHRTIPISLPHSGPSPSPVPTPPCHPAGHERLVHTTAQCTCADCPTRVPRGPCGRCVSQMQQQMMMQQHQVRRGVLQSGGRRCEPPCFQPPPPLSRKGKWACVTCGLALRVVCRVPVF
jgi:hypothetical protein